MKDYRMSTFRDFVGELTAIYRRTELPSVNITRSQDAADFIRPMFDEIMDDHEQTKVIHLSRSNGVVNVHHCSQGDVAGTVVPVKLILRHALMIQVSGIIMVHNHPSGRLKPSEADRKITEKLKAACALVDIQFLDSIIITREGYYSMADQGDF
ncbi:MULTISPECIES: JAB domain-containing protein [Flavobacteriaceae]|jgi:DNA repair protein RadC|uniref:DNA repair protein n=1 Tax=Arenibacter algicola TaxID=616991 RepID=A0A221V465_9FLAO|nr:MULTISPECIES: JAB domain-containing protein [Flavobacteriaceae]ASO08394.1 DNA repair protein [Arenibacter algicola]USD26995.1 JAB domain-containing protein [Allomuricauda aquimarina]|tara:strand:+ start:604 stop:1065 length:462 start_codon:yes stop_codon:yes gene_type:complete